MCISFDNEYKRVVFCMPINQRAKKKQKYSICVVQQHWATPLCVIILFCSLFSFGCLTSIRNCFDGKFRAWEKYSGGINNLSRSEYEIRGKCKENLLPEAFDFAAKNVNFFFGIPSNIRHNKEISFGERV